MENSYNENCVDIFNDTVDYTRNGDCVSLEESVSGSSGLEDYGIWRKEPGSVKKRRERFLRGTGLCEFVNSELELSRMMDEVTLAKCLELERISECSGAVSCTSDSFVTRQEEDLFCRRKDPDGDFRQGGSEGLGTADEFEIYAQETIVQEVNGQDHDRSIKKEFKSWFENMMYKRKGGGIESNVTVKVPNTNRMKVHHYKKRYMECTAVYMGQEVQAHKGFIWTLKFSPDGQYLASGGEDGVIRIWCVTSTNSSCKYSPAKATSKFVDKIKEGRIFPGRKSLNPATVIIPEKVFRIEESPLQEFHGHTSDVLDLCWSKSNLLLSSSKDNTVRLWEVGCDECLQIFCHKNYVTCIQFNPMIDGYFISGSIDGKVRIWGIAESRVVDWADVRDIVTAICYKPDGQRFVVGTITGRCRFYASSGNQLQLEAQIRLQTKKKSSSNKITSFQFSPEDSQRLMITSADSKVRIFDGINIIHKYKGLRKSGSLFSGSFTSNGRHIVSVGEDSHVYVWNHDDFHDPSSKYTKSTSSCEHFFFQGVSVAIPWSSSEVQQIGELCSLQAPPERLETSSCLGDSERFSLGGWFSMDGLSRGSATWPEEKLPLWDIPVTENDDDHHHLQPNGNTVLSATWGLVIVTADCNGVIRTFHNYGLPVRL